MIDLVVLDLDGTVIDPHSEAPIRPAVLRAIEEVRERGVGVSLATGRTLEYIRVRAAALPLHLPVITSQGAVIGDPLTGRILDERLLGAAETAAVAGYARHSQGVVACYFRDPRGGLRIAQNRQIRPASVYDHWFGPDREVGQDFSVHLEAGCQAIKFILVNQPPDEPDIVSSLQEHFGPAVGIVRTHPSLVEGTAAGVDKGSGLRRLLEMLQVPSPRVLVVGDQDNDIPMFRVAGTAVAMGQAEEQVRRAAHWVAPSLDEDGVAVALRRYVLT